MVARGLHVAEDVRRAVGDVVYAAEDVVERGDGVVHEVHRLAGDIGEVVRGAAHVAGDGVEPVGDVGGGVARVQQRDVEEVVQLGELGREVLGRGGGEVEREVGLHLADDAADLLAAQDAAAVGAVFNKAGLTPDDAADVVAHVLIAHGPGVHAGAEGAGGEARDAAGVGVVVDELGGGVEVRDAQAGEVGVYLLAGRVDGGGVHAADYAAQVLARDAAGVVLAGDGAGDAAVFDDAGLFVGADEAAGGGQGLYRAVEGAVADGAGVVAREAARVLGGAAGRDAAREVELLDLGAGLDVAEKARVRAVRREVQARYRVAAALEHAAEGGDGGKLRAREVDVRLEYDGDVL